MHAALDAALIEWIAAAAGGKVTRLERALARREAWLVDVERPGTAPLELFLRIAHAGDPANNRAALERETRVVCARRDGHPGARGDRGRAGDARGALRARCRAH